MKFERSFFFYKKVKISFLLCFLKNVQKLKFYYIFSLPRNKTFLENNLSIFSDIFSCWKLSIVDYRKRFYIYVNIFKKGRFFLFLSLTRILFQKCGIFPTLIPMLQEKNRKFHGEGILSKKGTSFRSSNCTITTWRFACFCNILVLSSMVGYISQLTNRWDRDYVGYTSNSSYRNTSATTLLESRSESANNACNAREKPVFPRLSSFFFSHMEHIKAIFM